MSRTPLKYTQAQMDVKVKAERETATKNLRDAISREQAMAATNVARARTEGEAAGRKLEVAIRNEGLSAEAIEVRGLLEAHARKAGRHSKRELAAHLYRIYTRGDSFLTRLGMLFGEYR
jgi:hypothetical protein